MAERAIIRQGDRTSHGGTVVEGHPFLIIHGKPAAGVGHKVHCPQCAGNVVIVEGTMNATMMGIRIAVEGMKTSCGATLIASQITDTIEYGAGNAPILTEAATLDLLETATLPENLAKSMPPYDEQVRILDGEGQPIAGMPYHITDESGNIFKGLTDNEGCCQRVHTENVQSLSILTGAAALEKWR